MGMILVKMLQQKPHDRKEIGTQFPVAVNWARGAKNLWVWGTIWKLNVESACKSL